MQHSRMIKPQRGVSQEEIRPITKQWIKRRNEEYLGKEVDFKTRAQRRAGNWKSSQDYRQAVPAKFGRSLNSKHRGKHELDSRLRQSRRRHLKELRKIAAENSLNQKKFVYKPGMIGLLRPNTPYNTTSYLCRQAQNRSNRVDDRVFMKRCISMKDDKSELTVVSVESEPKTPSVCPRLKILDDLSDRDDEKLSNMSGTMQGLVDSSFFDLDEQV